MHVKYSDRANADLQQIEAYISENDKPETATLIIQRILQALAILESFPDLGRMGRVDGTREFKITGLPYYAVYYKASQTELVIITVMHDRRQYPSEEA